MRRRLIAATVCLAAVAFIWNGRDSSRTDLPQDTKTVQEDVSTRSNAPPDQGTKPSITLLPVSEEADTLHSPETDGEEDLQMLESFFLAYQRALGENPTGENYEITAALTGSNSKGIAVLAGNHSSISPDGELLDRWGNPYHFHSISARIIEVRSPGPDGTLWSDDDVVLED